MNPKEKPTSPSVENFSEIDSRNAWVMRDYARDKQ